MVVARLAYSSRVVVFQFFGYKEEDKGYYAGLVASCIFLGRVFSRFVDMGGINHT